LQAYHYVPEDTTCAVLFMDMVPINNWNLIKIVVAVFNEIAILCLVSVSPWRTTIFKREGSHSL
jgi:hypothetical protein